MSDTPVINPDATRPMPRINTVAMASLYRWEVRRYLKGWQHSVVGPVGTTLLFLAIFGLALGGLRADVRGIPFTHYVVSGLVTMVTVQTSYEMTAWATIDSKIRGTLAALLGAPLRPIELTAVLLAAGTTAGLATGTLALIGLSLFIPIVPASVVLMIVYGVPGSVLGAATGLATGFWATRFDHVGNMAGLVVGPLIFLSGVFFPITAYGWGFDTLARLSPAFWIIDGVRNGHVGVAEGTVLSTLLPLMIVTGLMALLCQRIVATGYKVKQ
ncbi:MAG: ABC transporter permease [Rhodospirillales bacterium]|nr:ABC transporter permease [Rhodospirillales bacterium]